MKKNLAGWILRDNERKTEQKKDVREKISKKKLVSAFYVNDGKLKGVFYFVYVRVFRRTLN